MEDEHGNGRTLGEVESGKGHTGGEPDMREDEHSDGRTPQRKRDKSGKGRIGLICLNLWRLRLSGMRLKCQLNIARDHAHILHL